MEKIVITGMGTINPVGLTVQETWKNIVNGVSGVAPITRFDASGWMAQIACEVKDFDPKNYMPIKEARRRDLFEQYATAAAQEALQNSGLEVTPENAPRIGVLVSSAMGGLASLEEAIFTLKDEGARRVSPFLIPMMMANGAAGMIGIDTGIKGPAMSVASACASGIDGIGLAWMMLRSGMIDAALTGASEATITETGIAAFDRIGALSRRNDDYTTVPAPFDKNRDGLVMGEGAGILMLERESHAIGRGANILAELAGYASTADAFHITAPSTGGVGGAAAISQALATAQVNPDEVDYISAHGTATQLNDASETKAIKAALGQHAYNTAISSTKSMTGHMMGATGALETIFCVQAIRENTLPPTIHYETPDPECDLDYVPNQAREKNVAVAISNAFGFGGHNSVLVVKEYL
ncbi:MAG: beta-ketoacyl-ACP synthase II [Anaerolineales bacterium]|uniref:3-oxoacyl-[acyl-carrier-protein] synthase 2 n=1 Tax=Candidatus Desulfolinea nitratireducens TaxID=2841698 RepID=A0A8J6NJ19_9CHLR|nr:beta-ketoacyl-ACP synthase II [Candidatus Desulfolinea nitratireducens]MBL6960384.1 beta-ketoacyl-ACP synthase II [Anaerolineales bacterium]